MEQGGLLYNAQVAHERITIEPDKMTGQPCIRGIRMPVVTIIGLLAQGWSEEQILSEWNDLEREDIRAALAYAADVLWDHTGPHFEI